jgi:hypothetical protein
MAVVSSVRMSTLTTFNERILSVLQAVLGGACAEMPSVTPDRLPFLRLSLRFKPVGSRDAQVDLLRLYRRRGGCRAPHCCARFLGCPGGDDEHRMRRGRGHRRRNRTGCQGGRSASARGARWLVRNGQRARRSGSELLAGRRPPSVHAPHSFRARSPYA